MLIRTVFSLLALASFGANAQAVEPAHQPAPNFELPYSCAYTFAGTTDANALPSRGVEFERISEVPTAALASAAGIVRDVRDSGMGDAGRYIVIDHGLGWTTTYTNLSRLDVRKHERIEAGQQLGTIGFIGKSLRSYLHYMQSRDGQPVSATFNGESAKYYGAQTYTSRNNCGRPGTITAQTGSGAPNQVGIVMVRDGVHESAGFIGELFIPNRVQVQCQLVGSNARRNVNAAVVGADLWYRIDYSGQTGYVPALDVLLPRGAKPAACAAPATLQVGQSVTLSRGQQINLPQGARLTYTGVLSDSRCRPGMYCIWAGEAQVQFQFTPAGGASRPLTIKVTGTGSGSATMGSWTLVLAKLGFEAVPKATVQLQK